MRTVIIMGAGGRDFHNFNTVFRNDPDTRVVAFTATQIPGIAGRTYPPALAGSCYPSGIPIRPIARKLELVNEDSDELVRRCVVGEFYRNTLVFGGIVNGDINAGHKRVNWV